MPLAAVMPAPHRAIELREFPEPTLELGAVLLDTLYSEVCGTDVHLRHGRLAGVPYPIIPGHVAVGQVSQVRGHVVDIDGNAIACGDRVTYLDVHETCHHCWYCLVAKQTTRCPARKVYGITYSAEDGLLGGWSQRIYLKPGVKILRLGEAVDPRLFMAAGCAMPTSLHAIERAGIRLGDHVAVQGAGPVGLCCGLLAKMSGAGRVILIDRRPQRLRIARDLAADEIIELPPEPTESAAAVERVRAATGGRGADVTIEATGVPAAVPDGMRMMRDGGRYVVVGHYTDGGDISINPHSDINRRHLEVRGCWGSDFSHFYQMVKLLDRFGAGRWRDLSRIITREYSLAEMNDALDDVEQGRVVKALVRPGPDSMASAG